jgi:multiple sugar transport system substrate-binding protein
MRAGIELPWEPKSWDDIIETAKTIKKKLPGICPLFIYAGLPPGERTTMQGFYMLLRGANGRLYDPEDEKWIAKSSALLKTLQAYWDIFVRYKLVPTDLMLYGRPHEAMEKGIQKGTLAIAISGSWCWEEVWGPEGRRPLPARDLVLGWAPMPGSGMPNAPEHVTVSGGWGWSINSKSSHPDEAFELIKILCSKEMITKLCTRISYIPPRKDVLETEAYMEQKFLTEAAKLTNITWFRPPLPEYPIITRYIQQATSRVITNECTPEEAMNLYAKEIEMILGPEKVKIEG